jgi:DNA polymerase-3 subunit beta
MGRFFPKTFMKIDSRLLLASLKRVAPAVSSNNLQMPILDYVRIKNGKITATDLVLTYIDDIDADTDTAILLPYKELLSIVSQLEGEIEIIDEKNKIKIISGFDIFEAGKSNDINLFPVVPQFNSEMIFTVDASFFQAIINASKCVMDAKSASVLSNISVKVTENNIDVAGSDGQKLYVQSIPIEGGLIGSFIISPIIARAISDFNIATVSFNEKFLRIEDATTQLIFTLSEGKYASYEVFFKKEIKPNIICNKKEFQKALAKAMVYNLPFHSIELIFNSDHIQMKVNHPETSRSLKVNCPAQISEDIESIGMLAQNIKTIVDITDGEELCIFVESEKKPMYIMGNNQKNLLLPFLKQN